MSDTENPASPSPAQRAAEAELQGLDPGELLARALHTVRPSAGASAWEPPTPEAVGRLLPQYRITSLLGRGGMGAVYKGVQFTLERPVAIKLLPAEIAEDAEFVARFQREARTLAKLQHARIVTIHDFGQTAEGHLYFVMEYIDGTDLRRILRGPGLDPEQAMTVVGQLCDALQAAHRAGIVHRDIKPENVLITRDGDVKLADFGLARPPREADVSGLTNTNVVMGTPDYMAPEQCFGATKADHRSDIFALGVMFYEMLTGQPPRGVFDPPSHKVQVDVRIDEVVLKALQSEPEYRYQQASEMRTDVDRIRKTPLPSVAVPTRPAALPWLRRNWKLASGMAAALAISLIAWAILHDSGKSGPSLPASEAAVRAQPPASAPSSEPIPTPKHSPEIIAPSVAPKVVSTVPPAGGPQPSANWRIPGLNESSFGGWDSVGSAKLEAANGIVTLSSLGGRAGLVSRRNDFAKYDLHVELTGSADVQAWVGVRMVLENGTWTGYTSHIDGRNGTIVSGHAGRNFATLTKAESPREYEGGMGKVETSPGQFFSLDFAIRDKDDSLWTKVDGKTTSGVGRRVAAQGQVGFMVSAGSLQIRKVEVREH